MNPNRKEISKDTEDCTHAPGVILSGGLGLRPQELVAKHFEKISAIPNPCICSICGVQTDNSLPISFLKKTFTNHDLLKYGNAGLCPECVSCLRRELLFTNFIATQEEFIQFKREGIIEHLFAPPEPPFVFCITQSYKKHSAIRSEISWSKECFHIREEDLAFYFEPNKWQQCYSIIENQIKIFSKTEIRTGEYLPKRISEYGMDQLLAETALLHPLRTTPQFDLLIYALIIPEREEKKCKSKENKQETLF